MAKKSEEKTRWWVIIPLTIITGLGVWLTVFSFWLTGTIFNKTFFVNGVVSALKSEPARSEISDLVLKKTLSDYPLIYKLVGNTLKVKIEEVLLSKQMEFVYTQAGNEVFRQMTEKDASGVSLDFSKYSVFLPLVKKLDANINIPEKIVILPQGQIPSVYRYKMAAGVLGPVGIGLVLLVLGVMLVIAKSLGDKLKAVGILGLMTGAIGVLIYLLVPNVTSQVMMQITSPLANAIAGQIIGTYLDNLVPVVAKVSIGAVAVGIVGLGSGFLVKK